MSNAVVLHPSKGGMGVNGKYGMGIFWTILVPLLFAVYAFNGLFLHLRIQHLHRRIDFVESEMNRMVDAQAIMSTNEEHLLSYMQTIAMGVNTNAAEFINYEMHTEIRLERLEERNAHRALELDGPAKRINTRTSRRDVPTL